MDIFPPSTFPAPAYQLVSLLAKDAVFQYRDLDGHPRLHLNVIIDVIQLLDFRYLSSSGAEKAELLPQAIIFGRMLQLAPRNISLATSVKMEPFVDWYFGVQSHTHAH